MAVNKPGDLFGVPNNFGIITVVEVTVNKVNPSTLFPGDVIKDEIIIIQKLVFILGQCQISASITIYQFPDGSINILILLKFCLFYLQHNFLFPAWQPVVFIYPPLRQWYGCPLRIEIDEA